MIEENVKKVGFILAILLVISVVALSGCVEQPPVEPTNTAPVAGFTYTMENKTVTFTDASTDADTEDVLTYSWDFADGTTSTEMNPIHTYDENNTYAVVLTVSDGTDTDTATEDIIIGNIAPVAGFTYEATNLSVVFTDSSTDPNGDDTITTWSWDFNGDETADNTTQGPITYEYEAAGTYNATLTVTDDYGLENIYTVEIVVTE